MLWLVLFVLGIETSGANDSLPPARAELDTAAIYRDQTAVLTVEIDGQHAAVTPNFAPLADSFQVSGVNFGARLRIKDGRVRTVSQWAIHLEPTRTGRLVIPPLTIAGHRSPALSLEVRPAPPQRTPALLETELTVPTTPYVQAQLRYTVRLLYGGRLLNHDLPPPVVANATVQRLGNERRFTTERDGKRYQALEQRYAIFAERSGLLTIPAPRGSCRVIQASRERMPPQHLYFELTGEARQVNIQPRPNDFTGRHWLPAAAFSISERWPDPQTPLRVGEPAVRVLSLKAAGLQAAQLPDFPSQKLSWAQSYPDKPHNISLGIDDNQWLTHSREQRITLIPTQAGKLTLPEIRFRWWDTHSNRPQTARLPAKTVTVLPAPAVTPAVTQAVTPAVTPAAVPQAIAAVTPPSIASPTLILQPWRWLTWLLALVWPLTLIAWWLERRYYKII